MHGNLTKALLEQPSPSTWSSWPASFQTDQVNCRATRAAQLDQVADQANGHTTANVVMSHVSLHRARDNEGTHAGVVGKSPAMMKDHKRTWLEVAAQGTMKKWLLQIQFCLS